MAQRKTATKTTRPKTKAALQKRATSSTKRRPSASAQHKADPLIAEALKAVMPLLKSLHVPSATGRKAAREIIDEFALADTAPKTIGPIDRLRFLLSLKMSIRSLNGYATLDADHIKQINSLVSAIEVYVDDSSQQRPLNFMMLASPGAGKSHLIKCIASQLSRKNISAITFNMAGMQTNEDLIAPLDAARNLKVEDRLPLLFLDEFDSSQGNYALLLPLLWDGAISLGQRDLKLGKVVVVMAGSDPTLPDTMDIARSMRTDSPTPAGHNPKLVDLFSRVNGGVLRIPSFYNIAHTIDRRADKVCIAVELLKQRFGRKLSEVPLALLRFIARVDFRYDVRSIAHLIDLIPFQPDTECLELDKIGLPVASAPQLKASSLAYHLLHEDQALGIVKDWQEAAKTSMSILIRHQYAEMMDSIPLDMLEHYYMPEVLRAMGAKIKD